jgi:hypothetical protein
LRISVKFFNPDGRKIDVYPENQAEEIWLDHNMFLIFFNIRKLWSLNN